jgi:hypothetical protein
VTKPLPYWKRVAADRWVCPGSDLAVTYCFVNCHYLCFSGGKPLFQCLTLEEATEALHDLIEAREEEREL